MNRDRQWKPGALSHTFQVNKRDKTITVRHWETSDREVERSEGRFVTSRIVIEPKAISSRGESPLTFNWCFMAKVFVEPMN